MSEDASDAEPLRTHLELLEHARDLKHSLSANHEDSFDLPGSYREFRLTRPEFERMIASYIDRSCDICERLLRGAGLKPQQVSKVVLVGGSVRIPFVSQRLKERLGAPVMMVEQPDYAVCLGAALISGRLPDSRVPASARWRFRDACVQGQDHLHQDAEIEAQLRVLSVALNLRDEDAARVRAVPQLRAAYDRLMAALSDADWYEAELETRRVIQLASGHNRIVSEEMAMMIPAEVLAALDRLWILSGGGPLHSRKCVTYSAFGMSDFRAWNSCETWLQWRLRQLSMDRHRALRSAVGASLAGD
jgi:Hsp70 protein